MSTNSNLRALVDLRDRTLQKSRVAFGLRVGAVERGADTMNEAGLEIIQRWNDRFNALEEEADKDIENMVKEIPIVEHMTDVKGIGKMLAAKVVSMIDIERADTVSALWRYAGYGLGDYWQDANGNIVSPVSGWKFKPAKKKGDKKERVFDTPEPEEGWTKVKVIDRPIAHWCLPYNSRLKTTLYLVATSFMRCGSPYRKIYDEAREADAKSEHPLKDGHAHNRALRKMIKVWLSHLWEHWRKMEGLPVREIYVIEKLGHTHYTKPEDFGWRTL